MDGLGLKEVLELIYAKNTVPHLLSGKAISRAIRGHFVVESALHVILHDNSIHFRKHVTEVKAISIIFIVSGHKLNYLTTFKILGQFIK